MHYRTVVGMQRYGVTLGRQVGANRTPGERTAAVGLSNGRCRCLERARLTLSVNGYGAKYVKWRR